MFSELSSKKQIQVYRNALRKASNILVKDSKSKLRQTIGKAINSKNWWNGKTLGSGIKSSVSKDGLESKVHIMGDFRLKFFEKGTNIRRTKKGYNRGKISALYFFKRAKDSKEKEVFNSINSFISQSIQRVANRNRKQ